MSKGDRYQGRLGKETEEGGRGNEVLGKVRKRTERSKEGRSRKNN